MIHQHMLHEKNSPLGNFPDGPWVDARPYTHLDEAISAIAANEVTLLISGLKEIREQHLEIPPNITLHFLRGGKLYFETCGTLIINGPVQAGPHQIFTGQQRDVKFGENAVAEIHVSWFYNGIDGAIALLTALKATEDVKRPVILNHGITALFTGDTILGGAGILQPASNALIAVGGGTTVTIGCDFICGRYRCLHQIDWQDDYSGSDRIIFASDHLPPGGIYPEWFKDPTDTYWHKAINQACWCCPVKDPDKYSALVSLAAREYLINGPIYICGGGDDKILHTPPKPPAKYHSRLSWSHSGKRFVGAGSAGATGTRITMKSGTGKPVTVINAHFDTHHGPSVSNNPYVYAVSCEVRGFLVDMEPAGDLKHRRGSPHHNHTIAIDTSGFAYTLFENIKVRGRAKGQIAFYGVSETGHAPYYNIGKQLRLNGSGLPDTVGIYIGTANYPGRPNWGNFLNIQRVNSWHKNIWLERAGAINFNTLTCESATDVHIEVGIPDQLPIPGIVKIAGGSGGTLGVDLRQQPLADGEWTGAFIYITTGQGAGQLRIIKTVKADGNLTVHGDWTTPPTVGDEVAIGFVISGLPVTDLPSKGTVANGLVDKSTDWNIGKGRVTFQYAIKISHQKPAPFDTKIETQSRIVNLRLGNMWVLDKPWNGYAPTKGDTYSIRLTSGLSNFKSLYMEGAAHTMWRFNPGAKNIKVEFGSHDSAPHTYLGTLSGEINPYSDKIIALTFSADSIGRNETIGLEPHLSRYGSFDALGMPMGTQFVPLSATASCAGLIQGEVVYQIICGESSHRHEVSLRNGDKNNIILSRNRHVAHHSWDDQTPNYDEVNLGLYGLRVTARSENAKFDQNGTINLGVTVLIALRGW